MVLFRQLFDPVSSTYTYLVADPESREALLIDPVFEHASRDAALIRELGLTLTWTLETHVHADHVTGAWALSQRLGSQIAVAADSGAKGAHRALHDRDKVNFGKRHLQVRATPGHTLGCVTYVRDDEVMAFTGDCVLIRGCGRTDFQQGDPRAMFRSVHAQIFSLPEACLLYPAHDYRGLTATSVAEERTFNPRLGGQVSEDDFVGYMMHLGLPHPKKIDIAVPANLVCGRPDNDQAMPDEPSWAPLELTFAGIWEVEPLWVEAHLPQIQLVDVRTPEEYDGPLGHIRGARLLPLESLAQRSSELSPDSPIVTVCRAGGRSAQATVMLQKAGFHDVANLAGGMLRWCSLRLPVESSAD